VQRVIRFFRGRPWWVWALWGIGALVIVTTPMALTEPAMWAYLTEPELLALVVGVALRYSGLQLRMLLPRRVRERS